MLRQYCAYRVPMARRIDLAHSNEASGAFGRRGLLAARILGCTPPKIFLFGAEFAACLAGMRDETDDDRSGTGPVTAPSPRARAN